MKSKYRVRCGKYINGKYHEHIYDCFNLNDMLCTVEAITNAEWEVKEITEIQD